jgi:hypothetical protein
MMKSGTKELIQMQQPLSNSIAEHIKDFQMTR